MDVLLTLTSQLGRLPDNQLISHNNRLESDWTNTAYTDHVTSSRTWYHVNTKSRPAPGAARGSLAGLGRPVRQLGVAPRLNYTMYTMYHGTMYRPVHAL